MISMGRFDLNKTVHLRGATAKKCRKISQAKWYVKTKWYFERYACNREESVMTLLCKISLFLPLVCFFFFPLLLL